MGCPCGAETNLQLTPPWYHHSPVQGSQGHEEGRTQEQPCRMPGGTRKEHIQNCCKTEDAAWSSLASKLEAGGAMKHPTSSACLPTPEPAPAPGHSKQPPVPLWCPGGQPAATSFAASLLFEDLSPHHHLDGDLGHLLAHATPPVVEGLDLYLPYLKHIWRLASTKTVCAWKLPSKTALYQWTFMRPKRCGGKKKIKNCRTQTEFIQRNHGLRGF